MRRGRVCGCVLGKMYTCFQVCHRFLPDRIRVLVHLPAGQPLLQQRHVYGGGRGGGLWLFWELAWPVLQPVQGRVDGRRCRHHHHHHRRLHPRDSRYAACNAI